MPSPPERRSQSRRAYEYLRQRILDWELPPGTRISEIRTSREIGGSRTPVREALQQLSREGLVRTVAGHGAFVAEISLRDIVEMFEMREALEVGVARLAARSRDRRVLAPLEAQFEQFADGMTDQQTPAYYELISRFDEALLVLCNNQRLVNALADVWLQAQRLRNIAASDPARLRETVGEHLVILRAVLAGSEDEAVARVREHVQRSAQNVLRTVTAMGGQRFVTVTVDRMRESGETG